MPTSDDPDLTDVVGLDIGGTKTHGVRWSNGDVAAEAKTGSANVQNVSTDAAAGNLAELFRTLGGQVGKVIAGSGGVDTDDDAAQLRALIAPHAPGASVEVVHDTRLILAAGGAATGIAVIVGTGSVAWGVDEAGREARSGGWGYLLGDEGSGYWVGREAVRLTLHRFNLEQDPGILGDSVLEANGVHSPEELIALFHGETGRRYWAGQAGLVFSAAAAGDAGAASIIDTAAAHVCSLVADVAGVIGVRGPVIIGGGLAVNQPAMQGLIINGLLARDLDVVRFLAADPVMGVEYLLRAGLPVD